MYVSLTSKKAVEIESLSAASAAVRQFIESKDFGSSYFIGVEVYDSLANKLIARVSYNGRIWDALGAAILDD